MTRLFLLVVLCLALPVHAMDEDLFPNEHRGFYVGGGGSFTNVVATDGDGSFSSERGDSDYGFTLSAGYRLNPWLAFDIAYLDGGKPTFDESAFGTRADTEIDLSAIQFAGVGTLPFFGIYELYVKLGVSAWDADSDQLLTPVSGPSVFRREERSGPGFLFGFGLGVALSPSLHARIEYQSFGIDDELLALDTLDIFEDNASFDTVNLQLHYRFGPREERRPLRKPDDTTPMY